MIWGGVTWFTHNHSRHLLASPKKGDNCSQRRSARSWDMHFPLKGYYQLVTTSLGLGWEILCDPACLSKTTSPPPNPSVIPPPHPLVWGGRGLYRILLGGPYITNDSSYTRCFRTSPWQRDLFLDITWQNVANLSQYWDGQPPESQAPLDVCLYRIHIMTIIIKCAELLIPVSV